MASYYMGPAAAVNEHKTGLKFPNLRVGAYSVNLVVQASACCGKDTFNGTWEEKSFLGLAGPENLTNAQKRLGLMGTEPDVGTGLHRRESFVGTSAPLDNHPQIIGFVFKEGRMSYFRNGVKVGTFSAHSTAFSTLGWINGWLDAATGSTGQFAEVKLYNQAFSDTVMLRLQKLLECKWHIADAQGAEYADCSLAEGGEEPAAGCILPTTGTLAASYGWYQTTVPSGLVASTKNYLSTVLVGPGTLPSGRAFASEDVLEAQVVTANPIYIPFIFQTEYAHVQIAINLADIPDADFPLSFTGSAAYLSGQPEKRPSVIELLKAGTDPVTTVNAVDKNEVFIAKFRIAPDMTASLQNSRLRLVAELTGTGGKFKRFEAGARITMGLRTTTHQLDGPVLIDRAAFEAIPEYVASAQAKGNAVYTTWSGGSVGSGSIVPTPASSTAVNTATFHLFDQTFTDAGSYADLSAMALSLNTQFAAAHLATFNNLQPCLFEVYGSSNGGTFFPFPVTMYAGAESPIPGGTTHRDLVSLPLGVLRASSPGDQCVINDGVTSVPLNSTEVGRHGLAWVNIETTDSVMTPIASSSDWC